MSQVLICAKIAFFFLYFFCKNDFVNSNIKFDRVFITVQNKRKDIKAEIRTFLIVGG